MIIIISILRGVGVMECALVDVQVDYYYKFIETYCSPRAEVKTYRYTVRILKIKK